MRERPFQPVRVLRVLPQDTREVLGKRLRAAEAAATAAEKRAAEESAFRVDVVQVHHRSNGNPLIHPRPVALPLTLTLSSTTTAVPGSRFLCLHNLLDPNPSLALCARVGASLNI